MQTINKESSVQNTPGEAKRLFMRSKLSSTLWEAFIKTSNKHAVQSCNKNVQYFMQHVFTESKFTQVFQRFWIVFLLLFEVSRYIGWFC